MRTEFPIALKQASTPVVSIIICVSNGIDLLLECLRSVAEFGPADIQFQTIVVLNNPSDNDETDLRKATTGVEVISSPVNLGLAGGSNLGRQYARGEYIVILHDDATVEAGWLETLVDAAIEHPQAGIVGGKSLFPDLSFQNAGMVQWRDGTCSWLPADMPTADENSPPIPVDLCGSSSLLIRAELWDTIGGLDENFYPAYYVDADVAMAARQQGLIVLCEAKSLIRHHLTASSSSRFRSFLLDRNRQLFMKKWGRVLEDYESLDPDNVRQSIERALVRASRPPKAISIKSESVYYSANADRLDRLNNHIKRDEIIKRDFDAYLIAALDAAEGNQDYSPKYVPNTIISFHKTGDGFKYLVRGDYYGPDNWGSSLQSTKARLLLPLDCGTTDLASSIRLVVEIYHFINASRPFSPFMLSLNGIQIININETRIGIQKYRVAVPANIYKVTSCLVICMETLNPVSHFVKETSEIRTLSAGIRSLRIDLSEQSE